MSVYGDVRTQIQRNLGGRDDTDTQAANLDNFNHAQKFLADIYKWPELQVKVTAALTASDNEYSETDLGLTRVRTFHNMRLVDGTESYRLKYYTPDRWITEVEPWLVQGIEDKPYCWTRWGKTIYFYYIPDSNYSVPIWYWQYPTVMVDDNTTIQYDDVDDILVAMATAITYDSFEEYTQAEKYWKRAERRLGAFGIGNLNMNSLRAGLRFDEGGVAQSANWWNNPWISGR